VLRTNECTVSIGSEIDRFRWGFGVVSALIKIDGTIGDGFTLAPDDSIVSGNPLLTQ
jgi:hypothetical protein